MRKTLTTASLALAMLASGCAMLGLETAVQAPQLRHADERPGEIRLLGPSAERPLGGVALRLWAHVHNPNAFGVALTSVEGALRLEQQFAANVSFPLGLPLRAATDTIIPLDIMIGFADVPGLRDPLMRAVEGAPVRYNLEGTMRIDAGVFGNPAFGPMTLLQGSVSTR
jgi:hypothetical protein